MNKLHRNLEANEKYSCLINKMLKHFMTNNCGSYKRKDCFCKNQNEETQ